MLRRSISIVGLIAFLIVFTASTVQAAAINVANGIVVVAADGQCSLIEAIVNANADAAMHADCPAGSGADTISLASGSTYTLTAVDNSVGNLGGNGLPAVTSSITINGNGTTIARGSGAPNFRIFYVDTGGNLTLNFITVTGGNTGAYAGGGIYSNSATLTIANATLSNNTAGGVGGGLHSVSSTLTVNNSTVTSNSGYGIAVTFGSATVADSTFSSNSDDGLSAHGDPTLTVANSTFSNNGGSGLAVLSGTATITDSAFSNNHDTYNGGGLTIGTNGSVPVVTVTNSTFTGNSANNMGGAVASSGALTINNSTISGNSVNNIGNTGFGGGIANSGNLTLNSLTLSNNTAGASGGGIYNWAGTITITGSLVSANRTSASGGGIANDGGGVTINDSVVTSNSAYNGGAGITNVNGTLTINNSSISNNSTTYNDGGGIYSYQGTLRVNSNAIYNNSAVNGGGLYGNGGTIDITNSTFSSNIADPVTGSGGAIASTGAGPMTINNSTISSNSAFYGGGIASIAAVTIRNTIIANSVSGGDCAGSIINGGNNIIEDNTCGFVGGNDPLLGPLANNGGPTLTHALLSGSPAIDAGDNATCAGTDQRGISRPQNGTCDIGAYEVEIASTTATATATSTATPTASATATHTSTPTSTATATPTNTPTATPTAGSVLIINFPRNGIQVSTTRPLFDWSNVSGATSYTLQISAQQNFSTFVLNSIISPSAYVMPIDLPRNVLLFWRVRANGAHGSGDWSRTRHFFSANPPGVPVLVSPANIATLTSNQPALDWNDSSPAADYYEVQISTVSTFATFLGRGFSGRAYQSNYIPQAVLGLGTTYHWRVRAVNAAGQFSQWSAPRTFTTP